MRFFVRRIIKANKPKTLTTSEAPSFSSKVIRSDRLPTTNYANLWGVVVDCFLSFSGSFDRWGNTSSEQACLSKNVEKGLDKLYCQWADGSGFFPFPVGSSGVVIITATRDAPCLEMSLMQEHNRRYNWRCTSILRLEDGEEEGSICSRTC